MRLRQSDRQKRRLEWLVDLIKANPKLPVVFGDGYEIESSELENGRIAVRLKEIDE